MQLFRSDWLKKIIKKKCRITLQGQQREWWTERVYTCHSAVSERSGNKNLDSNNLGIWRSARETWYGQRGLGAADSCLVVEVIVLGGGGGGGGNGNDGRRVNWKGWTNYWTRIWWYNIGHLVFHTRDGAKRSQILLHTNICTLVFTEHSNAQVQVQVHHTHTHTHTHAHTHGRTPKHTRTQVEGVIRMVSGSHILAICQYD